MATSAEEVADADSSANHDFVHDRIEEYELAIASKTVTIDQIVDAYRKKEHGTSLAELSTYAHYYQLLYDCFAENNNGIEKSYFASYTSTAVILTKDKELHVKLAASLVQDVELIGIVSRLTLLHLQAREILSPDDFRTCMDPVFTVISFCLEALDTSYYSLQTSPPTTDSDPNRIMAEQRATVKEVLKREYKRAEEDFFRVLQRTALVRYFYGMLIGIGLLVSLILASVFYVNRFTQVDPSSFARAVLVAAVAGSIGATISVLTRISSGRFSLSRGTLALQRVRSKMLVLLGGLRPAIGAAFASAFVVFQIGNLIPIKPAEGVLLPAYYAGVGFIAGFSERWAQDMVVSTSTTLLEERPSESSPTASELPASAAVLQGPK